MGFFAKTVVQDYHQKHIRRCRRGGSKVNLKNVDKTPFAAITHSPPIVSVLVYFIGSISGG